MLGGAATIRKVSERVGAARLMRRGAGTRSLGKKSSATHGAGVLNDGPKGRRSIPALEKNVREPQEPRQEEQRHPRGGGFCHNQKRQ